MSELAKEVASDLAVTIRNYVRPKPAATMPRKLYIGTAFGAPVVVVEGNLRTPLPQRGYRSLDGFSWGYNGSGPMDLALSLLTDAVGPDLAHDNYIEFCGQVVADLPPRKPWSLKQSAILAWVAFHTSGLNDLCVECGGDLLDFDPPNASLFVKATDERCGACEGQRVEAVGS